MKREVDVWIYKEEISVYTKFSIIICTRDKEEEGSSMLGEIRRFRRGSE